MLLNMEAGHYYSLLGVGAALWQQITGGTTREALLASLESAYSAEDEAQLAGDLDAFLEALRQEELLMDCSDTQAVEVKFDQQYAAPKLATYSDLQDLLLLDPIHDVDETGWPAAKP